VGWLLSKKKRRQDARIRLSSASFLRKWQAEVLEKNLIANEHSATQPQPKSSPRNTRMNANMRMQAAALSGPPTIQAHGKAPFLYSRQLA
jgi:hypothetical protein